MSKPRAKWDDATRGFFITSMVTETALGNCADSGFKKASWQRIINDLNDLAKPSQQLFTKQQCQSLYPKLKADWVIYSYIMNNSGFGIDPDTHVPTAAKSVWETLIIAHPSAGQFKGKPLKYFEELDLIFSGGGATGKYAKSPFTAASVTPGPGRNALDCEDDCDRVSKKARKSLAATPAQFQAWKSVEQENSNDEEEIAHPQAAKIPAVHINLGKCVAEGICLFMCITAFS